MKKILALLMLLVSLILPWACSDNNSRSTPSAPSLGGSGSPTATPTAPIIGTPGTPTNTPVLAAPPPYLSEWPASSAPNGFYLGAGNQLFVAENDNALPYMEEFNTANGTIITHWNIMVTGCTLGTTLILNGPQGVAFTPNNVGGSFACLLDVNSSNGSVSLYASFAGGFPDIGPVNSSSWGSLPMKSPQGFATDGNYVYVADTGNGYVEEFDPNAGCPSNLGWIHRWKGYSPNNFRQPTAVAIDPGGNIWVGDAGYSPSLIENFASGGTTYINQWLTIPGCTVNGLAVTASGATTYVYVSDSTNQMVEEYDQNGNLLREWGNPHSPHEFQPFKPSCIAIDSANNQIIVGDQNNDTIEVFGP